MLDDLNLRGSVELTVLRGNQVLCTTSRNYDGFCAIGGRINGCLEHER